MNKLSEDELYDMTQEFLVGKPGSRSDQAFVSPSISEYVSSRLVEVADLLSKAERQFETNPARGRKNLVEARKILKNLQDLKNESF